MTGSDQPFIKADTPLPPAAALALEQLTRTYASRTVAADGKVPQLLVGLAGSSPLVDEVLGELRVVCPPTPESLAIARLQHGGLVIAGSDDLGLAYALAEVSRAVACAPAGSEPLSRVIEIAESPVLAWRSMQLFLCNRDLEAEWYFDEGFWAGYVDQLRDCRYNNLSLTFGHQTPYLTPPYPFLVDMGDFDVTLRDYTAADRTRGLRALQRASEITRGRGLHFTLGIWSQRPEPFGEPMLDGLDEVDVVEFNAVDLERLLAACPLVDGVQFRMNYESGISENRQGEFYERQFRVVADCGRPIRLDLRAKGLSDEVVRQARSLVPDTVVSTKFWCEHLGQPYAMPAIKRDDVSHYRRYGYWDLLSRPAQTPLIYRLWSAGSQRALLWGTPLWVERFARACGSHTEGFEVMAPLTNKGGINHPGCWQLLADATDQPFEWEYQRYWMFYLLFGRLGYDPNAPREIWQRELGNRFGAAAAPVEGAYRATGEILPLLTTVLQSSASLWSFWPEMYAGRSLVLDIAVEPSDPTQFYGVGEYVEEALTGQLCGKWTPCHVADRLDELADESRQAIAAADGADAAASREYAATRVDTLAYASLGAYHADRLRSMCDLAFFLRTGCRHRIGSAAEHLRRARQHWVELVQLTDGVYHDDLVFGYLSDQEYPDGLLSKDLSYRHDGHWKDRLEVIDADAAYLEEAARQVAGRKSGTTTYAGESGLPGLPGIRCQLPDRVAPGSDLTVEMEVDGMADAVICHHRAMLQCRPFTCRPMERRGPMEFATEIPAADVDGRWDLMVFFELRLENGEARRWPDWREQAPYLTITTTSKQLTGGR